MKKVKQFIFWSLGFRVINSRLDYSLLIIKYIDRASVRNMNFFVLVFLNSAIYFYIFGVMTPSLGSYLWGGDCGNSSFLLHTTIYAFYYLYNLVMYELINNGSIRLVHSFNEDFFFFFNLLIVVEFF